MDAKIYRLGPLWIADLRTRYGRMEYLCGQADEPDIRSLLFLEAFMSDGIDHIGEVRASAVSIPMLWRPIRLAVNNEGRMGLQFMNRMTGKQIGMFFADEHSSFKTRLKDIQVRDEDKKRLTTPFTVP